MQYLLMNLFQIISTMLIVVNLLEKAHANTVDFSLNKITSTKIRSVNLHDTPKKA